MLLLRYLMEQPVVCVKDVKDKLKISYSKANNLISGMEQLGIMKQITPGKRSRKFIYQQYVNILSEGTEPNLYI